MALWEFDFSTGRYGTDLFLLARNLHVFLNIGKDRTWMK